MVLLRHVARFVRDQAMFGWRTGSWWIPLAIIVLGLVVLAAATAQVVVPHAVYVLF